MINIPRNARSFKRVEKLLSESAGQVVDHPQGEGQAEKGPQKHHNPTRPGISRVLGFQLGEVQRRDPLPFLEDKLAGVHRKEDGVHLFQGLLLALQGLRQVIGNVGHHQVLHQLAHQEPVGGGEVGGYVPAVADRGPVEVVNLQKRERRLDGALLFGGQGAQDEFLGFGEGQGLPGNNPLAVNLLQHLGHQRFQGRGKIGLGQELESGGREACPQDLVEFRLAIDQLEIHRRKIAIMRRPLGSRVQAKLLVDPQGGLAQEFQAAVEVVLDFGDDLVVQVKDRRQGGQDLPLAVPGSFLVFHLEVPRRSDGLLGNGVHLVGSQGNLRLGRYDHGDHQAQGNEQEDLQGLLVPGHVEGFAQPRPAQPGPNRAALLLQAGDIILIAALYPAWLTSSRRGAAGFWRRASYARMMSCTRGWRTTSRSLK